MSKVYDTLYLCDDAVVIDIAADCTCYYEPATRWEPELFECNVTRMDVQVTVRNDDGEFVVIDQELPRWADFGRFDSLIEWLTGECPHVEDSIYKAIAEGGVV